MAALRRWLALSWPLLCCAPWYLITLSPGLSWAHQGADSGDLLSALALDTLPHPPGYPSWLLLLEAWLLLPWPDAARAAALASAVAVSAALLIWHDVLRRRYPRGPWAGLAVVWLGLQPLVWSQAVIVEVYAAALLTAVLIWRTLDWAAAEPTRASRLLLIGIVIGAATGIHLTLLALLISGGALLRWTAWRRQSALIGLGLLLGSSVWLVLWVRGAPTTPAGWGNVRDAAGFGWMVSAQIYREAAFGLDAAGLIERLRDWSTTAWGGLFQLSLLPALVGLREAGAAVPLARRWILLPAGVIGVFALGYARHDAQVLLVVPLTGMSLLIAGGLTRVAARAAQPAILAGVVAGLLLLQAVVLRPQLDASQAAAARDFAEQVLAAAPARALLLSDDDRSSFAVSYLHFAEHVRPDVVVIVTPLLRYDWYQQRLAAAYPTLQLPGALRSGWEAALVQRNPDYRPCRISAANPPFLRCRAD